MAWFHAVVGGAGMRYLMMVLRGNMRRNKGVHISCLLYTSVKRRKTPEDVLERLLDGQDGVVVGRASDFAFKNRNDAVRIFPVSYTHLDVYKRQHSGGSSSWTCDT